MEWKTGTVVVYKTHREKDDRNPCEMGLLKLKLEVKKNKKGEEQR